jgi:hypothetical protein
MSKPAITIVRPKVVFTIADPGKDLPDVVHILMNLRIHTDLWSRHYGAQHKQSKVYWEKKADEWLDNHKKAETNKTDI